jgi:hypothetical protein
VQYSKAFFALQLRFATLAAELTGVPIERALLDYTNLYVRFGLGRAFDPAHPAWRRYVDGVHRETDLAQWTHRFYLAHADAFQAPQRVATFGCFSYEMQDAGRVRLHFENVDSPAVSPLSIERLPHRLAELRSLFAHVGRHQRQAARVVGTSWLHNLLAYQRCFPREYAASATVTESKFRTLPLWGQFVDRNGELRADITDDFLRRLTHAAHAARAAHAAHAQDLARCFPFQALAVDAPIGVFYRFYDVDEHLIGVSNPAS